MFIAIPYLSRSDRFNVKLKCADEASTLRSPEAESFGPLDRT
jgi:hypothetical protein